MCQGPIYRSKIYKSGIACWILKKKTMKNIETLSNRRVTKINLTTILVEEALSDDRKSKFGTLEMTT